MVNEKWEWIETSLIKTDGENPNSMTKEQREALKNNIKRFGWNMPIITDMNLVVADGEQKLTVAKEMGLGTVPILRKELTVTERKIVRQSMNKLRGTHDIDKDALEFRKILEKEDMASLSSLIGTSDQQILITINKAELDLHKVQSVSKTGSLVLTCPKCKHQFKKEEMTK